MCGHRPKVSQVNRGRQGPHGWRVAKSGVYYASRQDGASHCTVWLHRQDDGLSDRLVGVTSTDEAARRMVAEMAEGR